MPKNLYVTAMQPQSGKSIVALGLMELLSARVARPGFFRPIIPAGPGPDSQIELVRRRYRLQASYEEMYALDEDEAAEIHAYDELRKRVVEAYRRLADKCDFVLCEGTDFTRVTPGLDVGLNADLANELGAPVLIVVRAGAPAATATTVRVAADALHHKGCAVFGVVVTRAPEGTADDLLRRVAQETPTPDAVYVVPERPELSRSTVAEVAAALDARLLAGTVGLDREVRDVHVAAGTVEHFLDELAEATLVVVPADRPDILLASVACALSPAVPTIAAVVVTGGHMLSDGVSRVLAGAPFPILEATQPTNAVLAVLQSIHPTIQPDDRRKIATALRAFEGAVDAEELMRRIAIDRPRRVTPIMFEYELLERARSLGKRIVLPEGDDERVLRAADVLLRRGGIAVTVLGRSDAVRARAAAAGADLGDAEVVDPSSSPLRERFAARYLELRRHKGITEDTAFDVVADANYFATLMLLEGEVDGMVSGAAHTTGDTIRPAFEVIKARAGVSLVSSVFFMCLADRVLVYGDCAVNPRPDVEQLAEIAITSADTAAAFGIEPRIAMLSYSTGTSGRGADVDAVEAATAAVRRRRPDLEVEGPIQYDAAVDASVAKAKLPDSNVAGRASVFIFPDLDAGNVAYKAVQRSANAVAIGPILQGLNKPVNDLSRGCTVTDVVNTAAITAIQARQPG